MVDREVVRAFVTEGAQVGFGPSLNIERDALLFEGWWHAAFRVAPDTFIVRTDEPPGATAVLDDVAAELSARGLRPAGESLPAIVALTYAELSLSEGVGWSLWARDPTSGEADLAARVGAESYLDGAGVTSGGKAVPTGPVPDLSAELEGARRMAGLPATVVVAVGVGADKVNQLQPAMPECRFETVELDAALSACGALQPALVLVDATTQAGRDFIMEFRADACGRFLPVVALTPDDVPLGADIALHPDHDPLSWVEPLRRLLP